MTVVGRLEKSSGTDQPSTTRSICRWERISAPVPTTNLKSEVGKVVDIADNFGWSIEEKLRKEVVNLVDGDYIRESRHQVTPSGWEI